MPAITTTTEQETIKMARKAAIGGIEPNTKDKFDMLKLSCKLGPEGSKLSADNLLNLLMDTFSCIDGLLRDVISLYRTDRKFQSSLKEFYGHFREGVYDVMDFNQIDILIKCKKNPEFKEELTKFASQLYEEMNNEDSQ
jgi:hypothetical protein